MKQTKLIPKNTVEKVSKKEKEVKKNIKEKDNNSQMLNEDEIEEESSLVIDMDAGSVEENGLPHIDEFTVKRKRGRPRKISLPETNTQEVAKKAVEKEVMKNCKDVVKGSQMYDTETEDECGLVIDEGSVDVVEAASMNEKVAEEKSDTVTKRNLRKRKSCTEDLESDAFDDEKNKEESVEMDKDETILSPKKRVQKIEKSDDEDEIEKKDKAVKEDGGNVKCVRKGRPIKKTAEQKKTIAKAEIKKIQEVKEALKKKMQGASIKSIEGNQEKDPIKVEKKSKNESVEISKPMCSKSISILDELLPVDLKPTTSEDTTLQGMQNDNSDRSPSEKESKKKTHAKGNASKVAFVPPKYESISPPDEKSISSKDVRFGADSVMQTFMPTETIESIKGSVIGNFDNSVFG